MNKFLLTLTVTIFSLCAKAQTEKGTVYIGGSASVYLSNNESNNYSYKSNRVYILPTIGLFLAKNFSIALTPQYNYVKDSNIYGLNSMYNTYNKSNRLGGGIDLRYYWTIIPQLSFFTQLSGSYLTSVGKNNNADTKLFNTNLSPAFAFFATKKLALIFRYGVLAYAHQKDKGAIGTSTSYSFGFNVNEGLGLGLNYHLSK